MIILATPIVKQNVYLSEETRYRNKFNSEWSAEFPGIVKCNMSAEKARCIYCNTEFGIGHGGRSDVKCRVEREAHSNAVADAKKAGRQVRLSDMRCPPRANATLDYKVAKAEALWCKFITEHNLPFAVSDCFCELVSIMFTDSSIASKFACRRTKTAAVVTEALAPDEIKKTVQYANEGPVTLMLDESNKRNNDKGCAILLRMVNPERSRSE